MNKLPHIIGLTKVRNEAHIIEDTLNAWGEICTGGIVVYDDVSDDDTVRLCKIHPSVKDVIVGDYWDPAREKAEWYNRQVALMRAQQFATPDTWFVYFDADEFLFNFTEFGLFENPDVQAIACRLYDFYITPEDVELPYNKREWVGPEFRTITMFFKNSPHLVYNLPDQRIVTLGPDVHNIPIHGDIKHYGKGFSVDQWEKTCDYYIKFWPKYSSKWMKRKGKAIHTEMLSDFGNKLIKWSDRKTGFSLEMQSYGKN